MRGEHRRIQVGESSTSSRLFDRAQRVIPGGVNSPARAFGAVGGEPIFFASAIGNRLIDVDDRGVREQLRVIDEDLPDPLEVAAVADDDQVRVEVVRGTRDEPLGARHERVALGDGVTADRLDARSVQLEQLRDRIVRFLRRKVLTAGPGAGFLVDLAHTESLDEGDAFTFIQRHAMQGRRTMKAVAQLVVDGELSP